MPHILIDMHTFPIPLPLFLFFIQIWKANILNTIIKQKSNLKGFVSRSGGFCADVFPWGNICQ